MTSIQQPTVNATTSTTGAAVFSKGILGQAQMGAQGMGLFGLLMALLGGSQSSTGQDISGLLNGQSGTQLSSLLGAQTGGAQTLSPDVLAGLLKGKTDNQINLQDLLTSLLTAQTNATEGQNLPTDTANLAQSFSLQDILAALGQTDKGQKLLNLMSSSSSVKDLQDKFSALPDDDKNAVLQSLAAVLMIQQPAPQPTLSSQIADTGLEIDSDLSQGQQSGLKELQQALAEAAALKKAEPSQATDQSIEAQPSTTKKEAADKALQAAMEKAQALLSGNKADITETVSPDAAFVQQLQSALADVRNQNKKDLSEASSQTPPSTASTSPTSVAGVTSVSATTSTTEQKPHESQKSAQTEAVKTLGDTLSKPAQPQEASTSSVAQSSDISSAHKGGFETLLKDAASVQNNKAAADSSNIKFDKHGAHIPVSEQVALKLSKATQTGDRNITIKLVPAELGRIDVRLEMSADGRVTASFQVEQPATLDLLQKDAKGLERAFTDAGLKTDSQSLNFNMRGGDQRQPGTQGQQMNQGGNSNRQENQQQQAATGSSQPSDLIGTDLELSWTINPARVNVRV